MELRRILLFFVQLSLLTTVSIKACPLPCSCSNSRVNCYGKHLKVIPSNFPADTVYIDLQTNDIESIEDQFQNISTVQEIMLRFNRISHISEGAFENLPNLKHINIGSNLITTIGPGVFLNVPMMKTLDLTDNRLTSIDGSFDHLQSLIKLVLTRNRLENLTEAGLGQLTKLVYFMAEENQISTIEVTAFSSTKELSYMSLRRNPLSNMDQVLSKNSILSYLDVSNCQLDNVPTGLPWAIRYLQLSKNNITKISKDTFMSTRFLGIIILDENKIMEIQPGAFTPIAHLQEIWLNGNQLKTLPSPIPSTIKTLCVEKNEITKVGIANFPEGSKMKLLSLKGNKIDGISPYTFSNLKSLEKLYLGSNAIDKLKDKSFSGLRNLTTLDIGRNPVTHIDTRFAAGLQGLQNLDMSFIEDTEPFMKGNFFRDVPYLKSLSLRYSPFLAQNIMTSNETLKSFYNLNTLDLRDNNLRTLEFDLPRFFPNLHTLWLARNAWVCDTRLLWLHDWIQRSPQTFPDTDQVQCALPMHLAGSAIADLPYYAFHYTTTTTTTSVVTTEISTTEEFWSGDSSGEVSAGDEFTDVPFMTTDYSTMLPSTASSSNTYSSTDNDTKNKTQTKITVFDFSTSMTDGDSTTTTAHDANMKNSTVPSTVTPSPTQNHASQESTTLTVISKATKPGPLSTSEKSSINPSTTSTPVASLISSSLKPQPSSVKTTRPALTTVTRSHTTLQTSTIPTDKPSTYGFTTKSKDTTTETSTTTRTTYSTDSTTTKKPSTTKTTTHPSTSPPSTTAKASDTTTTDNIADEKSPKTKLTSVHQRTSSTVKTTGTSITTVPSTTTISTTSRPQSSPTSRSQPSTKSSPQTNTNKPDSPTSIQTTTTMSNHIPEDFPLPGTSTTTETSNDIPRYGGSQNRMPSVADSSGQIQTIIIATSVTIMALILVLIAAALVLRYRKKLQTAYHRAFTYTIETSDTAFVLSDQDEPDTLHDSRPSTPRSRSDRGSMGSRRSVEIAGDGDQSMDMFMWNEY